MYKEYFDQYFGTQIVQSIQLLSMTDPKDEAGYYSGEQIYFSKCGMIYIFFSFSDIYVHFN